MPVVSYQVPLVWKVACMTVIMSGTTSAQGCYYSIELPKANDSLCSQGHVLKVNLVIKMESRLTENLCFIKLSNESCYFVSSLGICFERYRC